MKNSAKKIGYLPESVMVLNVNQMTVQHSEKSYYYFDIAVYTPNSETLSMEPDKRPKPGYENGKVFDLFTSTYKFETESELVEFCKLPSNAVMATLKAMADTLNVRYEKHNPFIGLSDNFFDKVNSEIEELRAKLRALEKLA